MSILVGDIGGTNARFALVEPGFQAFTLGAERTYSSRGFSSLGDAVQRFVDEVPEARSAAAACFGLPGPIRGQSCETTNLPWVVDGVELARALGLPHVPLLNDVEAAAWGLTVLPQDGLQTLRHGDVHAVGNCALLAPGTGLGEAVLAWNGTGHYPYATEGGHVDFSPADDQQVALWRYLAKTHGHVSWERVASGPGLATIYRFLLAEDDAVGPPWLTNDDDETIPATITRQAQAGDARCGDALALFFRLLGAEAGNLALKSLATSGLYLAGGILPQLRSELEASGFWEALGAKGRFRSLLEAIPVHLVTDPRLAFWGAAARAMHEDARYQMAPPKVRSLTA